MTLGVRARREVGTSSCFMWITSSSTLQGLQIPTRGRTTSRLARPVALHAARDAAYRGGEAGAGVEQVAERGPG